jgi:hypothetical protein
MDNKTLTPDTMKRDGAYNWKNQPDRLIYLRRFNGWHQFKKLGDPRDVWCEVLDEDLCMLEETACACREGECESKPAGCRMSVEVARRDPAAM